MNAAARELPVYSESVLAHQAPDENAYFGSVLFFKHVILAVTILLIAVPTVLSFYLGAQVRELRQELTELRSAAVQAGPSAVSALPAEPFELTPGEPPAPELPAYAALYPELYIDTDSSLRSTEDTEHCVYLTFDDGPSERTDEILKILEQYGVKATFFVVGADGEADLQRMRDIVAAGHTLGLHSYSHNYQKIYASVEAYLEDFNTLFCQIVDATGVKPQLLRFPGGSVNGYNSAIYQQLIAELTRRGFVYFDWNVDNGDSIYSGVRPTQAVLANAIAGIGTARRAMILMHDSSPKTTTVEALPAVIESYAQAGYTFAPLTVATRPVTFSYKN